VLRADVSRVRADLGSDTRRRLLENQRLVTVMFDVTPPGADLYPFDSRLCSHSPSQRCSGTIGCRVDPAIAAAFNRKAGAWWSEVHRAAKTRAINLEHQRPKAR
jgi:hypothetical protein